VDPRAGCEPVRASDAEPGRFDRALDAGTREMADDLELLQSEPAEALDFDR
jgi:hypothetical protein